MQLGIVGLGRMGGNIARRLMRGGHACVVFDRDARQVADLAGEGADGAADLAGVIDKLSAPRSVWAMLPTGKPTDETIAALR